MPRVSRNFLIRLKLNDEPQYRIAQAAAVDPVKLSKLINGADPLKPEDTRIVAVGRVLGLSPEECFEPDPVKLEATA